LQRSKTALPSDTHRGSQEDGHQSIRVRGVPDTGQGEVERSTRHLINQDSLALSRGDVLERLDGGGGGQVDRQAGVGRLAERTRTQARRGVGVKQRGAGEEGGLGAGLELDIDHPARGIKGGAHSPQTVAGDAHAAACGAVGGGDDRVVAAQGEALG